MYLDNDIKRLLDLAVHDDRIIFASLVDEQDIEICDYLVAHNLLKKNGHSYKIDLLGYNFLESRLTYEEWTKQHTAKGNLIVGGHGNRTKTYFKIACWIVGIIAAIAIGYFLLKK